MIQKHKMLISILLIFIASFVIYYAAPYKYWFAKFLSIVHPGNENSITVYNGYVKIDSTTFERVTSALQEKGCKEKMAMTSEISRCYYQQRRLPVTGDSLAIYPSGLGWGPISFTITTDKLFFSKEISGKPDLENLKTHVRKDASFAGVQIHENSWRLESVGYPVNLIH